MQTIHFYFSPTRKVSRRTAERIERAMAEMTAQDPAEARARWDAAFREARKDLRATLGIARLAPVAPIELEPTDPELADRLDKPRDFDRVRLEHRRRWLETHPDERTAQDDADGL